MSEGFSMNFVCFSWLGVLPSDDKIVVRLASEVKQFLGESAKIETKVHACHGANGSVSRIQADDPTSQPRHADSFLIPPRHPAVRSGSFAYEISMNTSGLCSAIRNKATAGPLGLRRPCSQS